MIKSIAKEEKERKINTKYGRGGTHLNGRCVQATKLAPPGLGLGAHHTSQGRNTNTISNKITTIIQQYI